MSELIRLLVGNRDDVVRGKLPDGIRDFIVRPAYHPDPEPGLPFRWELVAGALSIATVIGIGIVIAAFVRPAVMHILSAVSAPR